MSVKDLLSTPERWAKGAIKQQTEHGCRYCLFGGLMEVYLHSGPVFLPYSAACGRVMTAISKLFPKRAPSITRFNDHPKTTFEDIVAVLDEAKV